jgi:hypothetical protein
MLETLRLGASKLEMEIVNNPGVLAHFLLDAVNTQSILC